ncbi:MAG: hypothetical protein ABSA69_11145 [Verrucomicrobiota bacterium]|jgi:O-antigen/teichoic acid export membrane protein
MKRSLKALLQTSVVWFWILNAFRLASGLILLPLVLRVFTKADLGMYYVLLSLAALTPLIDFGFGNTIGRFVSYAMGGAETLQAHGVATSSILKGPNYPLLWQLLRTTRALYRYLTLALLVILGIWGTYMVELRIYETSSPLITRLAWITTLGSTLFDIYSNWWDVFLRGMNEVRAAARIVVAALTLKFAVSVALLLGGAGLLSIPLATLVSCVLQRQLARRRCLALLKEEPLATRHNLKENLKILWPNSWRIGIHSISSYLTVNANLAICVHAFGLAANGKYGLSVQLMSIAAGMASVWLLTKWPLINQLQARGEPASVRRTFWSRLWLQNATFLPLTAGIVFVIPWLLRWFGSGKTVLPLIWLLGLTLTTFLDLQFSSWGTLISTANRVPYLWPSVATNIVSLTLSLILVHFPSLGLGALVLGPLLAGSAFNYWYWPLFGARSLGTSLFRFLFLGPTHAAAANSARPTVHT